MTFEYGVTGIKYEEYKEFRDSYNKSIYETAFRQTTHIISRNITIIEKKQRGKQYYSYNELPNVITFMGSRGSGKTSAMLSFMESLKEYHKISSRKETMPEFRLSIDKEVMFTCLDCIDGSLLEKGEDIFKIVLAQMYQRFLETEKEIYYERPRFERGSKTEGEIEYPKRELQERFETLYKSVCTLDEFSSERVHAGESYMSSLKTLARSQKVREEFEELVRIYLSFMRRNGRSYSVGKESQHYLVVTVDDIDLNVQNGFQMLEKIHRYLMIPNIIVLLSMDYEQMLTLCEKNFFEILPKVNKVLVEGMNHVNEVSTDYLDKVLPINYRIYMHRSDRTDSKGKLLNGLLETSGVAFDAKGLKLHFYEQKSLRNTANFQMILEMMKPLCHDGDIDAVWTTEDKEEELQICERNHHILESDLQTRMLLEKVEKDKDRDFLRTVMKENLRRSMQRVIEFARTVGNERAVVIEESEATYGALLNVMYDWGRIKNGCYKPMVHCLLAYYSYGFTGLYIREKLNGGKDKEFLKVISKSIAGKWAEDMIPPIGARSWEEKPVEESALLHGYSPKEPHTVKQYATRTLRQLLAVKLIDQEKLKREEDISTYIKKTIYGIEILFMSINNLQKSGIDSLRYKVEISEKIDQRTADVSETVQLYVEDDKGKTKTDLTGAFNIFGFVENSVLWKEKLSPIEEGLETALGNHYDLSESKITGLLSMDYGDWEKNYNDNLPVPVYWFDMTYNVLKRVRRNARERNPEYISRTDFFDYLRQVYVDMAEELDRQEEFYNSHSENKNIRFAEKFRECPYIKYFLDETDVEEKKELFVDFVYRMEMARDV